MRAKAGSAENPPQNAEIADLLFLIATKQMG